MRVIGVGFGRTGTLSLKSALEELGAGPCFHMMDLITGERRDRDLPHWGRVANGDLVDWNEVFEGWEATVDWPGAARWEELIEAFPDASVLLNVRDFDGFYKSCANTILAAKEGAIAGTLAKDANRPPPAPELLTVIEKLIWEGDFRGRFADKEWVRRMYYDRIEAIKATVPPERLTLWNLGVDGWAPLAEMLDVEAPDKEFPRLHDTNEFRNEFGLPPLDV
ncbi:MAG: sulfotransferase family protein [Dehalococcoidia bacterium]|nr:sulfotransferase family protein [Dehalococcoidia bacterium]